MPGAADALSTGEHAMPADGHRMLDGRNGDGLPGGRNAMSRGADQVPGTADALSTADHAVSADANGVFDSREHSVSRGRNAMSCGADQVPGTGDALPASEHAMSGDADPVPCHGYDLLDGSHSDGVSPDRNAVSGAADQMPGGVHPLPAAEYSMSGGADPMPADGYDVFVGSHGDGVSTDRNALPR
jgi:hypothetical protein